MPISNFHIEDLPDDLLIKVFSYLDISDIIHCGQISKRIRGLSHNESLWLKVNLYNRTVSTEFLRFILRNGCKYLSLRNAKVTGNTLSLNKTSELKYLDLGQDLDLST